MKLSTRLLTGAFMFLIAALLAMPAFADAADSDEQDSNTSSNTESADENELTLEEVITTGTRSSRPRSAVDSPVPVDVLKGDEINSFGNSADLTDSLKGLVPSYTATPATGDGSAFVRPTSLRGTAPDQVLVLVDGKRWHRSALVHFFAPAAGNGAHGPDIGMIPGIAIKRVEVLRDGASSQYGSDAIAGVINFITRDASEGGEAYAQYGRYYQGEDSKRFAFNAGLGGADSPWFVNFSIEYTNNEALSRGIQRIADAQALKAAGVPDEVIGADTPYNDRPLLQTWGRPEQKGTRTFLNSGYDLSDTSHLYARFSYADTDGRYRFFYRNPNHPSLVPLREMGFNGLPAGYTPYLDGAQEDYSAVIGWEGEFSNGMYYDFSYNYGINKLDYFLNNTVNPTLGLDENLQIPQRDFDVGGYNQEEINLNADFSLPLSDTLNLAFGAEWRQETYRAKVGERNSWIGAGSNGLKGVTPKDSGEFDRDNWAVYADVEHDITERLLLQYALRYENFSDVGGTTNGKVAARFSVTDGFALRGAVSTGFHAPTPGQANVRTTITTFDGRTGQQVEEGLVAADDPRIVDVGGKPLKEETALNISAGFVASLGDWGDLTVDFYQIEVDDRIYRTGDIPVPGTDAATISFYTNALDVRHQGMDLVFNSAFDWPGTGGTNVTLAYSYNDIDVTNQKLINGAQPVNDGLVEDIENNYPHHRAVLTANTFFGEKWNAMIRANYYGSHWDERGRIGAADHPSKKIGALTYFDVEIGYQMTQNFRLAAGGVNVFDTFPDEIHEPYANRLSVGLQYPRRSAANYEGGSWYVRGTVTW